MPPGVVLPSKLPEHHPRTSQRNAQVYIRLVGAKGVKLAELRLVDRPLHEYPQVVVPQPGKR